MLQNDGTINRPWHWIHHCISHLFGDILVDTKTENQYLFLVRFGGHIDIVSNFYQKQKKNNHIFCDSIFVASLKKTGGKFHLETDMNDLIWPMPKSSNYNKVIIDLIFEKSLGIICYRDSKCNKNNKLLIIINIIVITAVVTDYNKDMPNFLLKSARVMIHCIGWSAVWRDDVAPPSWHDMHRS